ncbi:MAG: RNA polymerase-associated protein RapA [Oceanospirillaceae bacterium]|nr:RNA polymerase-associated protein RapA [Oceanospirillaceae bacterium]|tara:strand:+ start:4206 stop:6941 length:2736 start_codon:yes stop_codon:yes gene_type:complete
MFVIGQRWISEAETELGLGLIQNVDFRVVEVFFPAQDEVRSYAIKNSPLTRVTFSEGDVIPLHDGSVMTVAEVDEIDGICYYGDGERTVPEIHLSGAIKLNSPSDRLFTGQLDNNNLFELRQIAFRQVADLRKRPFYGLLGARTSLLPHQLHIASQVTQDALPRVLLADEVGMGKTIEAGLILHRLIRLQRIQRVLILVPDHLVHQWLVEMIRRFNLYFSVLNEQDLLEDEQALSAGQLFICPMSLAVSDIATAEILSEDWDVLVVDEAHHLSWAPDHQDDAYRLVETLSMIVPSVLLLTATPEQLGVEGHYARLRLLDPVRYASLEEFLREQQEYLPYAELAGVVNEGAELSVDQQALLAQKLPDLAGSGDARRITEALIDRFGPGRALYRNTRHGVKGFPERQVSITTLELPSEYKDGAHFPLHPEVALEDWVLIDPRVNWVIDLLAVHKQEKFVLICHSAETVLMLERYLWEKHAIPVAVFHEHMDMIERDRAAAYFADHEQGAKLLLCSEIGSEGRNFQFASHLILFDLPFNCDLIEQRIGRLDRIGQKNDIRLHIPVFDHHATSVWADVLNVVLDCFSHPNPTAQPLLEKHRKTIEQALQSGRMAADEMDVIRNERIDLQARYEQGRDRLLELHSCPPSAQQAAKDMTICHIEDEAELSDFLELFADAFGLEVTDLGNDCVTIAPGEHMLVPDLPHLPEDGFMATVSREMALSRDDVQFLSWEHPFIEQALELITSSPAGNAAVGYLDQHEFNTGDCFIELQFTARCPAPRALQIERFLPPAAMQLTMTPAGQLKVNETAYTGFVLPLKKGTARGLVDKKEAMVRPLINKLEKMATGQLDKLLSRASGKAEEAYTDRIARLEALSQVNPAISPASVAELKQEKDAVLAVLGQSQLMLDSIRLVFCS